MLLPPSIAFIAAALVVELTPGPNMTYLALLSASRGRSAGFAAIAGVALGLLSVGIAACFGLAQIVADSPVLYHALRWCGAAYMVWLAWESWNYDARAETTEHKEARYKYFLRGLISNLLNPKAFLFYVSFLPAFADPARDLLRQMLALTFMYVVIATCVHTTIVISAGEAARFLKNPRVQRFARPSFALALLGVAVWFAWPTGG